MYGRHLVSGGGEGNGGLLELFSEWTRFPRGLCAGEGVHVGVGGGPKLISSFLAVKSN